MSNTTAANGKPRKQLSDQLDRLDGIIDAMAEGLNGAVADAAREGTRLAVKDAIVEIMTNPELRALIAPSAPAPAPAHDCPPALSPEPKLGVWACLKEKVAAAKAAMGRAADEVTGRVVSRFLAMRNGIRAVAHATGEVLRVRRVLWVAAGVGLTTGVLCLLMPHTMAAAVGAVGWAATAAGVQVGKWLRRAACRVGLL